MKVMIVSRGIPDNKNKTFGIFEFDQAKALSSIGVDVVYTVIDLRAVTKWRKWGFYKSKKDGIDIYTISIPCGGLPLFIKSLVGKCAFRWIFNKISELSGKPDIIHAHFFNIASYVSNYILKKNNIPFIITEHSSLLNKADLKKNINKRVKKIYSLAATIIAVSKTLADNIKNNFGLNCEIINNVVDVSNFSYCSKAVNDKFVFFCTANLCKNKNIDLLIESFKNVHDLYSNTSLIVFGDGPMKNELKKMIYELKLEDCITLKGKCSREIIGLEYKKGNCFVLPSKSETFGVSFIEAMAAGLPVISTKCGGPEEYITEENGLIIENNKDELVKAMIYMINNYNDYDNEKISKYIKEKFSPELIAENILSLYKKALDINEKDY